jgi:hypothetical protein
MRRLATSVDASSATWTNTIGDPELITVWKDPAFDPRQRAFYYMRVIEIPSPRWSAFDANRFGVQPLPGTAMTIQERAYTSPIWFTPWRSKLEPERKADRRSVEVNRLDRRAVAEVIIEIAPDA